MEKIVYTLVINRGRDEGFEVHEYSKEDFIMHTAKLLTKPKRIFSGLGDFLEIGDYNNLLDSIFFEREAVKFEVVLDRANRIVSEKGNIPASFLKLAVYYPDFLLKGVPTFCASIIGRKSRLTPGARNLIKYLREYPIVFLSAMPYEIAIEFVRRVGLGDENLISTVYKIEKDEHGRSVYAGGIERFISGDRKSLEIEKRLAAEDLKETDVVYMGRGEAGVKTFHTVNSIAFNPSDSIIPVSKITVYGSSLESLLVLFNFDGKLNNYLLSTKYEEFLPSLIVYSEKRNKAQKLVELEKEHRQLQNNIIGQRIEYEGESFDSVERDIEVEFGAATFDIKKIREEISQRMEKYHQDLNEFASKIFVMGLERYRTICST